MSDRLEILTDQLLSSVRHMAGNVHGDLLDNLDNAKTYISARILHLSAAVGEPGFELALMAERDAIAMHLGLLAVDSADKLDYELLGLLRGGLSIAAAALASV